MHDRPPSRCRKRRRRKKLTAVELREREERKREADALRKREQREREDDGIITFPGRCSPAVIDAMVARNKFLGMSEKEAERKARDPKQISVEAFDILDDWAPNWYLKK